jgi:hypothetical protein
MSIQILAPQNDGVVVPPFPARGTAASSGLSQVNGSLLQNGQVVFQADNNPADVTGPHSSYALTFSNITPGAYELRVENAGNSADAATVDITVNQG